MPASGGFEVEPAALYAGSSLLEEASSESRDHGRSVAMETSSAGCAAGVGPLTEELQGLGSDVEGAAGSLAGSLAAARTALATSAEAYARSDGPLAEAP